MRTTKTRIGNFDITSGKVVVSDPCYELDTWCQAVLDNVKCGKWFVTVEEVDASQTNGWGARISAIEAEHAIIKSVVTFEPIDADIGVDSGQAGIFDLACYQQDDQAPKDTEFIPKEPWYSSCCDLTLGPEGAGVIQGGCIASSGFGDGSYTCYVAKNEEKEITAIRIAFITEEDL